MKNTFEIPRSELDKLSRDLKRYGKNKEKEIWMEVARAADDIKNEAQSSAPRNTSNLASKIIAVPNKSDLEYTVMVKANYGPYVEFGTGKKVFKSSFKFTDKMKQYASQFKGKSQDHEGVSSRPYLFPAIDKYFPIMIKNIQKLLSKK